MSDSREQLYKEEANGILFGVCAGLASHFNINVMLVRMIFLVPSTWIIYLVLALLLPPKPAQSAEANFGKILEAVGEQLQGIEQNVIQIEAYVTSDEFELRRKLWDLQPLMITEH